jgi:hypothetical protein
MDVRTFRFTNRPQFDERAFMFPTVLPIAPPHLRDRANDQFLEQRPIELRLSRSSRGLPFDSGMVQRHKFTVDADGKRRTLKLMIGVSMRHTP